MGHGDDGWRSRRPGSVRALDFKAYYTGTIVDQPPDAGLYRTAVELFPDAVLEDAALDRRDAGSARRRARAGSRATRRSTRSPTSTRSPVAPRFLNIKPSRFGSAARLFECIDACSSAGMTLYGGGQFELGVGRGQIQALASLFYADSANDVAPGGYNAPEPVDGLPRSPLEPPARPAGFSWESGA